MRTKLFFILPVLALISFTGTAQKFKVLSGNFEALKNEKAFNVDFDYSEATFFKEKMSEADYVKKRQKEITSDKGAAEAAVWLADWEKTKEETMPGKFLASANKFNGKGITYSKGTDSPYTLVVKTTWVDPGWFGGVVKKPSQLNTILNFVASDDPDHVVLSISCNGALGDIYPTGIPNTNDRIAEAYAKTSKEFVGFMKKKIK